MKIDHTTVAVVTGAASGIGRALAERIAQTGAALALADVNEVGLKETAERARQHTSKVSKHIVDVSDRERVAAFAQEVVEEHGHASLLINNAGVALAGTVAEIALADIEWLMSINFWGVVYGVKHFLPILQAQPSAHIVNISSVFGLVAPPGQAAYAASKFAVRGFTEALRHEMKLDGGRVKVSCVHPGGIQTEIARSARRGAGASDETLRREIALLDQVAKTTAAQAAARIVRGIERNEERILVGADAIGIDKMQRTLPVRYWKVLGRLVEHMARKAEIHLAAR